MNLAQVLREEVVNEVQFELDSFNYNDYQKKYAVLNRQIQYCFKDGYNS